MDTERTWHDVFVENVYVVAPVRPGVFVPEADHVTELVDDYSELVAVLAYRDRLRSTTTLSHERTASAHTTSSVKERSQVK